MRRWDFGLAAAFFLPGRVQHRTSMAFTDRGTDFSQPFRRLIQSVYQDDRLTVDFPASGQRLEITYFDSRFRDGLRLSLYLLLILGVLLVAGRFIRSPAQ